MVLRRSSDVSRAAALALVWLAATCVLVSACRGIALAAAGTVMCPVVTGHSEKLPFAPHEGWVDVYARGDSTGKFARIGKDAKFQIGAAGPAALIASFDHVEALPIIVPKWPVEKGNYDISLWGDYVCVPGGYPDVWDKQYADVTGNWLQTFVARSTYLYTITAFDGPPIIEWGNKVHGSFLDGPPGSAPIMHRGYGDDDKCEFQTAHHSKHEFPCVGFRHGEIPVTPGKVYTAHIEGYRSHGGDHFQLPSFVLPDKGEGYAGGQVYKEGIGNPVEGDLCAIVQGNSNGQLMENLIRSEEWDVVLANCPPVGNWGQTFTSHGVSAAGLVFWATNGSTDGITCKVQIRENGPDGKIISPVRTATGHECPTGPQIRYPDCSGPPADFKNYGTQFCKVFQVAYFADEVKLQPEKAYYIDLQFSAPVLVYGDGDCYRGGFAYCESQKVEQAKWLQHGDKRWTLAADIVTYERPGGAPMK